jgi:hypothetical protein
MESSARGASWISNMDQTNVPRHSGFGAAIWWIIGVLLAGMLLWVLSMLGSPHPA